MFKWLLRDKYPVAAIPIDRPKSRAEKIFPLPEMRDRSISEAAETERLATAMMHEYGLTPENIDDAGYRIVVERSVGTMSVLLCKVVEASVVYL